MGEFEEDKESLIDLIIWYRDEYHKKEFGHNELIEQVRNAQKIEDLSGVEQVVDGWLCSRSYLEEE
jgi:hypothetical protein